MFYDIVGIKEKEAAQLNRSMPAGVESTSVKDSAKANSQTRDTFEAAESISETSVSTNSIRDNAKNVKGNGQNSDKRFSLMNNGIIAIELNTVKDPKTLNIILWCRRSPQKTTICAIPCRNAPIASNT